MRKLPKKYMIPNKFIPPIHNQGNKNNCTAHAVASAIEIELSKKLGKRVIVDVDDLWEKQKKFGTATEEGGDSLEDALFIAKKYGVRYFVKED